MKPSRGLLSTSGVVPACRTLDCVSIFAEDAAGAQLVWDTARGFDASDPFSRSPATGEDAAPWIASESFHFGCPGPEHLEFFGDHEAQRLYEQALAKMEQLGGIRVEIDFAPFRAAADLLYSGPWVAERLTVIENLLREQPDSVHPVVRKIIEGGAKYSASDAFRSVYRLAELKRITEAQWEEIDVMILPTTGTALTHAQVEADPIGANTKLGYYTNFVNLLDLAAIAVPAGLRPSGMPFGVSFIAPAFSDAALLRLASRYETGKPALATAPGSVAVAVVGAHLRGQPLNHELTARGATLREATRTAPHYRLYALSNTAPPKPGLVRDDSYQGPGIEVEVWSMPLNEFGSFVAGIPAPLGIGTAILADGSSVKCFICEPYAVAGSREITSYGGWRNYLTAKA
jgi:allophanate hydrolase